MKRGKHKSLDKELRRECQWIESLKDVSGVIVGRSEACRHKYAPGFIRIHMDVPAGFKAFGYAGYGVTDIYIYVAAEAKARVRKAIEDRQKK